MKHIANVIGGTGLVGIQLIHHLLNDTTFEKVRIFVRRDSGVSHPKLEQHIIDFSDSKTWAPLVTGDVLFSTLGTTLKQAGSKEKQYAIDYTLNYKFAQVAKENEIKSFVLVSSISANAASKIFYQKMKGELDDAVAKLSFSHLKIIRPGPLVGKRKEKRLGEIIIFPMLVFLSKFMLKKFKPISDSSVAQAMINAFKLKHNDKIIWEGSEVFTLAKEFPQPKSN